MQGPAVAVRELEEGGGRGIGQGIEVDDAETAGDIRGS